MVKEKMEYKILDLEGTLENENQSLILLFSSYLIIFGFQTLYE